MTQIERARADLVLVRQGRVPSREKARDLIKQGCVRLDGRTITKAGQLVATDSQFQIDDDLLRWASRGGLKLQAALEAFSLPDFSGAICIDLGASTGGFTDVLLARGARHVYAVDVGHGQLAPGLAGDARVTSLERTHARDLSPRLIDRPVDLVVCDLSFISVTKALGPALGLVRSGGWLISLVKPQFEAGRAALGKGGVVRDEAERLRALRSVEAYVTVDCGWQVRQSLASPLHGPDGNIEYLISAQKP